jgi:uncharacterized membrane protein
MGKILQIFSQLMSGAVGLVVGVVKFVLFLFLLGMVAALNDVLGEELTGGLIVLLIIFFVLYVIKAMKLREQRLKYQHDINILKTDVRKIGDDEAAQLAKKYKNK